MSRDQGIKRQTSRLLVNAFGTFQFEMITDVFTGPSASKMPNYRCALSRYDNGVTTDGTPFRGIEERVVALEWKVHAHKTAGILLLDTIRSASFPSRLGLPRVVGKNASRIYYWGC